MALVPFHAFLSVWLGHIAGHQAFWQAWKELIIITMVLVAVYLLAKRRISVAHLKIPVNYAVAGFATCALLVTLIAERFDATTLFGLKTDLEFLVVFVLAQLIAGQQLQRRLAKILIIASSLVVFFGLLQIYVLPKDFLVNFGYGSTSVVPYQMVDPAIDAVRVLSTLGGPNQLGGFLILPICLVVAWLIKRPRWWHGIFLIAAAIVEWHTYSRSAWLGLVVALLVTVVLTVQKGRRLPLLLGSLALLALLSGLIVANSNNSNLQYFIYHGNAKQAEPESSTPQHFSAITMALSEFKTHPLGEGLGAAGPASFYGTRPLISESYYLQLAIETGIFGLALFLAVQVLLAARLIELAPNSGSSMGVVGALVGIGVVNLFLHSWADSSTALAFWAYAGVTIRQG